MAQLKSFGVFQTAKFMAVMYFIMSAIFTVPLAIFSMTVGFATGEGEGVLGGLLGGIGIIFIPVLYAIIGFVFIALGCFVYNIVAGLVGGIEVELE